MKCGSNGDQGRRGQWLGSGRATAVIDMAGARPPTTGFEEDGSGRPPGKATSVALKHTKGGHLLPQELPRLRRPGNSICDQTMRGHQRMLLDNQKREAESNGGEAGSGDELGRGQQSRRWVSGRTQRHLPHPHSSWRGATTTTLTSHPPTSFQLLAPTVCHPRY
jgi:hypothetical protein